MVCHTTMKMFTGFMSGSASLFKCIIVKTLYNLKQSCSCCLRVLWLRCGCDWVITVIPLCRTCPISPEKYSFQSHVGLLSSFDYKPLGPIKMGGFIVRGR